MSCCYTACLFQKYLSEEECVPVCALCHIKRYAKGQCLRESYWANCVSMMLDGLALEVEQPSGSKPTVVGLNCAGSFLHLEELFQSDGDHDIDDFSDTLCAVNCTIAVFHAPQIKALMRDNPKITELLLHYCVKEALPARSDMIINLGFGDAHTSVKYLIRYLLQNGVSYLTHEQIALICHRSRQTITTTIGELQSTDPDLFTVKSDGPS